MDGNRRWAKSRNLPAEKGHENGYEKLKDVQKYFKNFNFFFFRLQIGV